MGPGVLLENGLPGAVLGVPGLLLLLLTLTTAMLSLVCAKPPICSRTMRFCRQAGCGAGCNASSDELMTMPVLSKSSAALSEDAAATAASGVWVWVGSTPVRPALAAAGTSGCLLPTEATWVGAVLLLACPACSAHHACCSWPAGLQTARQQPGCRQHHTSCLQTP